MNTSAPTHEQIAERAYQMWEAWGNPQGHDVEIWIEAERQLSTSAMAAKSGKQGARAPEEKFSNRDEAERLRGGMVSESSGEHQISPPIPENEASKAALQKSEARAARNPAKNAPKAKPVESGKPLWSKPHSA